MLKAFATDDRGKMIILGLSDKNLELLRAGKPIVVELKDIGLKGTVMIFNGPTEIEMVRILSEFIGADTKLVIDPRLVDD